MLKIYDDWELYHREVFIYLDNEKQKGVVLSQKLFEEMNIHTVFVLSQEDPKILGLINESTGELCLGYKTKSGVYDKLAELKGIEHKVVASYI